MVSQSSKRNDYKHFKTKAKYMILENVRHLKSVRYATKESHRKNILKYASTGSDNFSRLANPMISDVDKDFEVLLQNLVNRKESFEIRVLAPLHKYCS